MESKILPPEPLALMESTRSIGYSTATAIADIIDNSLAAGATRIDIRYSPDSAPYIAILDNGSGMDRESIELAMQYGGRSPLDTRDSHDLGRFGLGLKTASLSQCDRLTVLTKPGKGKRVIARAWDMDYIREQGAWALQVLGAADIESVPELPLLKRLEHGTLVVWQQLDRMLQSDSSRLVFNKKMDQVREHLALVFHRYLKGEAGLKKVKISMNEVEIKPSDPFLTNKSTQAAPAYNISGTAIRVTPYQLPYPSRLTKADMRKLGITADLEKNQGFYIYRNQRLIIWGTWFKRGYKNSLTKLARVQIDIPTSYDRDWVLDVKKASATPPEMVLRALESTMEYLRASSKRTYTYRGKKETDEKVEHIWSRLQGREDSIVYEINQHHPLVESIIQNHPETKRSLLSLLELIGTMLPLTQLRVDLTGSEAVGSAREVEEARALELLASLAGSVAVGARKSFLERMQYVEPFTPEIVAKYIEEQGL